MTDITGPWCVVSLSSINRHILVQLELPVLDALGNGDLDAARALCPEDLTLYLISDECRGTWRRRSAQIKKDAGDAVWVTRLIVDTQTGTIVGRAGFHGRPDQDGMVEVGYSIDPLHRRQGHARAALEIMLEVAKKEPNVKTVRATVRPDNLASRALIDQYGFKEVGEQWDKEDGLEVVLEISV